MYKSLDAGNTWKNITPAIYLEYEGRGEQGGFYSLDLDGKTLYVGTGPGLMKSQNYVDFEWEFKWGWDPVFDVDVEQGYGYMAISNYGSRSGILIKTPGSGWTDTDDNFLVFSARMVMVDPLWPDKVAYAYAHAAIDSSGFEYYRTTNGGRQWTLTGLFEMINVVAINNISYVFAAPNGYSIDSGDTWTDLPLLDFENSITACVGYKNEIFIASSLHELWFGSPGNMIDTGLRHQNYVETLAVSQGYLFGVSKEWGFLAGDLFRWKIPEVIMGVEEKTEPAGFSLAQNYPNPFNPITTITYSLPVDQNVLLTIYSITGQEVATLVNGYKTVGQYSVSWDGNGYSAGVYIAVIRTGGYYEEIKMILLK